MNWKPLCQILGFILIFLSFMMTLPVILLPGNDSGNWLSFVGSAGFCLTLGLALLLIGGRQTHRLRARDMFVLTSLAWFLIPLLSALPLLFNLQNLSLTDALFESVSGVTTTGSTVLSGLDHMPPDLLLWRSLMQWIGGVGIIGMAIAILPFLKVGGMRLFATESSEWGDKALPRTHTLARGLVLVYCGLTLIFALSYYALGMPFFAAVNHALTTVSTGGYSTSDASMGQFTALPLIFAATLFMMLGAMPFFLYVRAINGIWTPLWRDQQIHFFLLLLFVVATAITGYRLVQEDLDLLPTFAHALFNVTSVVTTTGYATTDYSLWGPAVIVLFFFLTFIGGCSGSTSGGMKIFRFQLCLRLFKLQILRLVHPNAVCTARYNRQPVDEDIIVSAVAFSFVFLLTLALVASLLAMTGLDALSSLSGAATALANVGPGLGDLIGPAGNFRMLSDPAKWVLMFAMILGRLELLTLFVVLSPAFWRD